MTIRASVRLALLCALLSGCGAATPAPSASSASTGEPSASPVATATATEQPSPVPIPVDEEMLARRFTVLVAGMDTNRVRQAAGLNEVNTDALMVVSVSADKSTISMMSLPRDTVDIPMPDGSIYRGKINGIAQRLGIEALRGAMATLLGVPIDRYIAVDMDDFAWMVDAVGGVDVDVKTPISDSHIHLRLDPGPAHLDGATALSFTRTRADDDYARAARQQQAIMALVRKWLDPGLDALIGSARLLGSLKTDIGVRELPTLLEIGRRSAAATVDGIVLQPPRFSLFVGIEPNSNRGWVMIPNVPAIRAYVLSVLAD